MKKKIIGILICTMLIVTTALSVSGLVIYRNIKLEEKQTVVEEVSTINGDDVDWWPMSRHDLNNTGNSSSPEAPDQPFVKWTFETNEGVHSSPAVVDGRVYIGSDDEQFYCLNAANGQKIWNRSLPGGASVASPAVYEGKVYQCSNYDYFYCWNANNGSLIWKYNKKSGLPGDATVADGKVYFGAGSSGKIFCLDADTGTEIWNYTTGYQINSAPCFVNEKLYIGSYSNHMYCLDANNGSKLWDFNAFSDVHSPAIVDGKVYFGGSGLYCLDADTGQYLWCYNGHTKCSPAVAYGKVYYQRNDGDMICLDAGNGDFVWNETIGSSSEISISSPAVADEKVYIKVWSTGDLFCLDAETGDIIWEYHQAGTPHWTWSSPAVVDGTLYVGGDYTEKVWAFWTPPGDPPVSPTIDGPTNGMAGTEYNYTFVTIDPDGDNVSYWVHWGDDSSSGWVGPYPSGESITLNHSWSLQGQYSITAKAKDSFGLESNWSDLFNVIMVNNPPNIPFDPVPPDSATDVDINASLSWNCSDPDGDDLTYDVYFEADDSTPDELVSSKQSNTTYDLDILDFETTYYWKIVAWDEYVAPTPGPIWSFTTEVNIPPNEPSDPDPPDGATDVSVNADLGWTGGDPNAGDTVKYDVYFGINSPPPKVSSNQSNTTYDLDILDFETTYYWQVVSWDSQKASSYGPIWHFTTEINNPPTAPTIKGETSGKAGKKYEYTFNAVDPDEDDVRYFIDWGDNSTEWTGFNASGTDVKVKHKWTEDGTYNITAKAEDIYGAEGPEGTLTVTMPRNKPFNFRSNLLGWLFERFPNLFPILQKLLQRLGL